MVEKVPKGTVTSGETHRLTRRGTATVKKAQSRGTLEKESSSMIEYMMQLGDMTREVRPGQRELVNHFKESRFNLGALENPGLGRASTDLVNQLSSNMMIDRRYYRCLDARKNKRCQ